jgi:hypothetical protein
MPDRILCAHPRKPANKPVGVSSLQSRLLAPEFVERLRKGDQQQVFGGHREPSFPGVEHLNGSMELR